MKKIIGTLGVGALALLFISSTCSGEAASEEGSAPAINEAGVATVAKSENGIDFKKVSLSKAKKMAADEGKLIFIDAYTTWCGPCKKMAKTTFMDSDIAELFNDNFINIKIEMEKDADGPDVARRYNVRAYPTLLIIDEEGNLIKQTIGFQDKAKLMNFAEAAL